MEKQKIIEAVLKESKAPPGWSKTVEHMKEDHPEIDNPFALCLSGDTKILLLDGTIKTIKELSEYGRDFWVYSIDNKYLNIVAGIARARHVGKKKVKKIVLDNDEIIKCTEEHRWYLRNGELKEACDLKVGDSLLPFAIKTYNSDEHISIYNPGLCCYTPAHAAIINSLGKHCPAKGYQVHHINGIKVDNRPENLEWLSNSEHKSNHLREAWKDEGFRKTMLKTITKNGENGKEKLRTFITNKWKEKEFREKMIEINRVNASAAGQKAAEVHSRKAKEEFDLLLQTIDVAKIEETYREKKSLVKTGREHNVSYHMMRKLKESGMVALNHKVKSTENNDVEIDVFDVAVDDHHNFAIKAGVFSHNSWWMYNKGDTPHPNKKK